MISGTFRLAFGGDEFDVSSFAAPSEPVAITYSGRRRRFHEGRPNEYCLYEFRMAEGDIRYADGESIGEAVFVTLPCALDEDLADGYATSAAIIDANDLVVPLGRAVLWRATQ